MIPCKLQPAYWFSESHIANRVGKVLVNAAQRLSKRPMEFCDVTLSEHVVNRKADLDMFWIISDVLVGWALADRIDFRVTEQAAIPA